MFKTPGGRTWKPVSTANLELRHYPADQGLLLVTGQNTYSSLPEDHDNLVNCVDTAALPHPSRAGWSLVDDARLAGNPHGDDQQYAARLTGYFQVNAAAAGRWWFAIQGHGVAEVAVDGEAVAGHYGEADPQAQIRGSIVLEPGWHQVVVRQAVADGGPAGPPSLRVSFLPPGAADWRPLATDSLALSIYAADQDHDGVANDLEHIVGTDPRAADSDLDGLTDFAELMLASAPLAGDSNNDGLADGVELLDKRDLDNDGRGNLFDDDNDGDGVGDGEDLSPFAAGASGPEYHLEVTTNGGATHLDFQIRPARSDRLALFGRQWDWPDGDTKGQMQDRDDSKEDVQLIPMLELTANMLPDQQAVADQGIYVADDPRLRTLRGRMDHNDGMAVGNVLGDDTAEIVIAWDKKHRITVRDRWGNELTHFDSVYSTGDKLAVGDVLDDARAEIIVFNDYNHKAYIYSGEGQLLGKVDVGFQRGDPAAVADVFGDAKAELLTATTVSGHVHAFSLRRYQYNAGLIETIHRAIAEDGLYTEDDGFGLVDVDGDGRAEVLVAHNMDDRLFIYDYQDAAGDPWNGEFQRLTAIDFDFDKNDGIAGADLLPSDDPTDPRYGEEILCLKAQHTAASRIDVYTEASGTVQHRVEHVTFSDFDAYTAADILGDGNKEVIVGSDTTGVVHIYNSVYGKAYVPLAPVRDRAGATVALQGRMVYSAAGKPVTLVADARLVWFVVGKTDDRDHPSANRTTVLAQYREDFRLTGLTATEFDGVTSTILFAPQGTDFQTAMGQTTAAYLRLADRFLHGELTSSALPDQLAADGLTLAHRQSAADDDTGARGWQDDTLENDVLPGLDPGDHCAVVAEEQSLTTQGLSQEDGLAPGRTLNFDLVSATGRVLKNVRLACYHTTTDGVVPLDSDDLRDRLEEAGYSSQEVERAIPDLVSAMDGEWGASDWSSPLRRDSATGILAAAGKTGGALFLGSTAGSNTVWAVRYLRLTNANIAARGYNLARVKFKEAVRIAKSTSVLTKLGISEVRAQQLMRVGKVGGGIATVVFAAYKFYQVASASGWSGSGIAAGALYGTMMVGYGVALVAISAIPGVGPVIAGLVILSDIIVWAITGETWSDKAVNWVVDQLSDLKDPPRLDLDVLDIDARIADYDDNGLDVGDRIEFACRFKETVSKRAKTKAADFRDSYLKPGAWFSQDDDRYDRHSYRYLVTNNLSDDKRTRIWDFGAWVEPKRAAANFSATVNMGADLLVYYRTCTAGFCDDYEHRRHVKKSRHKNVLSSKTLSFDVMPATLDDFIAWRWLVILDHDGDGLARTVERPITYGDETWYQLANGVPGPGEAVPPDAFLGTDADGQPPRLLAPQADEFGLWPPGLWTLEADPVAHAYHLRQRATGRYLAAAADGSGLLLADQPDGDLSLWLPEPAALDFYLLINRGRSQQEDSDHCLAAAGDGSGAVELVPCDRTSKTTYWRFQVGLAPTSPNAPDTDLDGLADGFEAMFFGAGMYLDPRNPDTDGDGLADREEILRGTDPSVADTDGDGLTDGEEVRGYPVTLQYNNLRLTLQVIPDPLVADTDGDEAGARPALNACSLDTDGDLRADDQDGDPLNAPGGPDTDYDHLSDAVETGGWTITVTTAGGSSQRQVDSDPTMADTDGDQVTDYDEYQVSDPRRADTDTDGLDDAAEAHHHTDVRDFDSDGDGLADGREIQELGTDPLVTDSDGDGLDDGQEVRTLGTDPRKKDSDADGLADSDEVRRYGTDPAAPDSDGDGLADGDEVTAYHTDPLRADSDGDGLTDGDEIQTSHTDANRPDSDGDGLTDKEEIDRQCPDANLVDTDGDGLDDRAELEEHHTSPCQADSDHDGLTDGDEVTTWHTDPLAGDTDNDGLTDHDEVHRQHTDPLVADTDGDGLDDGTEVRYHTNPQAADTDGDQVPDGRDPDGAGTLLPPTLVLYDDPNLPGLADFLQELAPAVGTAETAGNPIPAGAGTGRAPQAVTLPDTSGLTHGLPTDFPDPGAYPLVVLVGDPQGFTPGDGSVGEMMAAIVGPTGAGAMAGDVYERFAVAGLPAYTGLPAYSGNPLAPVGEMPPLPADHPLAQFGLQHSLVVMLTDIYPHDGARVLARLRALRRTLTENFTVATFVAGDLTGSPVTAFTLDGLTATSSRIVNAQLAASCGFAAAGLVAFPDELAPQQLRPANGLADGFQPAGRYLLVEAAGYPVTTPQSFPPTGPTIDPEPLADPLASLTLRLYYTVDDLDRSAPHDGDAGDIGDLDETTLTLYQWDDGSNTWLAVTPTQADTTDVTVDGRGYAGFLEATVAGPGLFVLAGRPNPDTTPAGPPVVIATRPADSATGVALDAPLQIEFSEPVTLVQTDELTSEGCEITGISLAADDRTVVLEHEPFTPGIDCTLTIPGNLVVDGAGEANDGPFSWSFTAEAADMRPFAQDDELTVAGDGAITGADLLADNGHGPDRDPEGAPLRLTAVNADPDLVGQAVPGSHGGRFIISADGRLDFQPETDFQDLAAGASRQTTIAYTLTDGTWEDTALVTVTVTGVNDPPTLSSHQRSLSAIPVNAGDDDGDGADGDNDGYDNHDNQGSTVSAVLASAGSATDVDGDPLGMALVGLASGHGVWQYRVGDGDWQAVPGDLSLENALLLGPADRLRFVPAAGQAGTGNGGVLFRAWDTTAGAAGDSGVDTTVGTAFSPAMAQAGIWVVPGRQVTLTVLRAGNGTVVSQPAGVDSGADCALTTPLGLEVHLSATAAAGHRFAGWLGAECGTDTTCVLAPATDTTVTAIFLPLSPSATPPPLDLPQSGQTVCTGADGTTIACAGSGQDGDDPLGRPWPEPRFRDNGDGTVTDRLTGLIWLADTSCLAATDWQGALAAVTALNQQPEHVACAATVPYADWRLPTISELASLVNYGAADQLSWLASQGMAGGGGPTWSATTMESNPDRAWTVDLDDGAIRALPKNDQHAVRPVRLPVRER